MAVAASELNSQHIQYGMYLNLKYYYLIHTSVVIPVVPNVLEYLAGLSRWLRQDVDELSARQRT